MARSLLQRIVDGETNGPFALVARRSHDLREMNVEAYVGDHRTYNRIADLPRGQDVESPQGGAGERYLVAVPFRQISEAGFVCKDDGEPLSTIFITDSERYAASEAIGQLPDVSRDLSNAAFDLDDPSYEARVRDLISREIGRGEGANFVLSRSIEGEIKDYSIACALSTFRALLVRETAAHWVFLIKLNGRILVGASPEQQITLRNGTASMNPISGTYRYPPSGPDIEGLLEFLGDQKEIDELSMVVDEELKLFGSFCRDGGTVRGPFLKELATVAHTEYYIDGETDATAATLLLKSFPAPTVTGSPVQNACRVIARSELRGRGYYSGVVGLIGVDENGRETLDSSLLIRTADISDDGKVRLTVGATIVRDSDPAAEAAETKAKASSLLAAFRSTSKDRLGSDIQVQRALASRNQQLSKFWLSASSQDFARSDVHRGRVLIVDAEDAFTQMLARVLSTTGLKPELRSAAQKPVDVDGFDLVVLGPGPGNPTDLADARVQGLRRTMEILLTRHKPFLAVCLSHQILCSRFGLDISRHRRPNQGTQRTVEFFGREVTVGFYNSFVARAFKRECSVEDLRFEVSRDFETGDVHGLKGEFFTSMQFHPESILSPDGPMVIRDEVRRILGGPSAQYRPSAPQVALAPPEFPFQFAHNP